jgi:hypothetical protein
MDLIWADMLLRASTCSEADVSAGRAIEGSVDADRPAFGPLKSYVSQIRLQFS